DILLARSILGTADASAIAANVQAFIRDTLDREIVGCSLFTQSVGAVFVLDLEDGRRVVLKGHVLSDGRSRGFASMGEPSAVYDAQAELAHAGFACAPVLVPPRRWPGGAAAVMGYLDAPRREDPHDPVVRAAMAGALARTMELGRSLRAREALPRVTMPAA